MHPINLLSVKNQSVHLSDTPIAKRKQSEILANHVAGFLANGNAIEQVVPVAKPVSPRPWGCFYTVSIDLGE